MSENSETKVMLRTIVRSLPWDSILKFMGGLVLTLGGWFLHLAWDEITAVKEKQSTQHDAIIELRIKADADRTSVNELKQLVKETNAKLDRLLERQAKP